MVVLAAIAQTVPAGMSGAGDGAEDESGAVYMSGE